MNKEIAAKWTAALRSGEFNQGTGALRDMDDRYCCLGVLCELAVREGVIQDLGMMSSTDNHYYGTREDDDYSSAVLPRIVRNWAELRTDLGYVGNDPENKSDDMEWSSWLTSINDHGATFLKIADIIDVKVSQL